MVAKRGRPVSNNPKDYMLRVRMSEEVLKKLDECCKVKNKTRSEIVRDGIETEYCKVKK